jgi:hypothetical protein
MIANMNSDTDYDQFPFGSLLRNPLTMLEFSSKAVVRPISCSAFVRFVCLREKVLRKVVTLLELSDHRISSGSVI